MKLIVQIPCFNEEKTLSGTVADIPSHIDGIDQIEILVIDDGSTDQTAQVARDVGVDHIVRHKRNRGLAQSFRTGIDASLKLGADIIVNTDADNQYCGADIPLLVRPVLAGEADIVVGDRETQKIPHFSWLKKKLQAFGSYFVRILSNLDVPDAVSGFRAISRETALRLNILSSFSYTTEMLIQAGNTRLKVLSVPVRTNPETREPRLYKSMSRFIVRSAVTMIRSFAMYRPLRVVSIIGGILVITGAVPISRFLYFYFTTGGAGHIQSLILGATMLVIGFLTYLVGLLADLINFNRQLLEISVEKLRELDLRTQQKPESRTVEKESTTQILNK